ncbi:MAG: transglycosylase domain-containing protein [Mogibacterium sp.]|nr:transglycosylase domain-containing protein [Mogibacterium sp.]
MKDKKKTRKKNTKKSTKTKFANASKGRKLLTVIGGLIALGAAVVLMTVVITAVKVGGINQESLYANIERSSILYDINGTEIDTLHYTEDRTIVPVSEMPDDLKNAFIAIEDKTFYKHHGFNFRRMFGAVLSKLIGRSASISGTSTITQQLARNAYLAEIKSQRSISRKLSEMYIAWRLEHKLTKDQILEAYLNTIYLGYGNYGVSAAARTYFSKDVSELTLAECAALAALPQAPDSYALITEEAEGNEEITNINYYSLDSMENTEEEETDNWDYTDTAEEETGGTGFYANDISKDRRDLVLELMADQGYISTSDAEGAQVNIIDILSPSFEEKESAYTYFSDYVANEVIKDLTEKYKISEEEAQRMVYTGGLEIHTTLRSDIQNAIYNEFQNDANFPTAVDGSKVQASMVVTEVGTGYISGFVGGRDAEGSNLFNRAISPRQPGSSIKPLAVYGAAIQKSFDYAAKNQTFKYTDYGFDTQGTNYWGDYITASSVVVDEPLTVNGEEWPQNFSKTYSGRNSLRTALQQSINTCAVKILWQVGLDYSMEMLEKYGLTTLETDTSASANDVNPAALALGAMTYGVTPLEMSLAYAAFPGGGKVNTPVCYTSVTDGNGKSLLKGESTSTKVLDEGVAWIMTDLLKSVVSRGIAGNAAISGVEVGGKTGTTNDTFDVWFDGFTPDYSAALWIGTDLNVEMLGSSAQAAALWSRIMGQVNGITNGEYLEMPSDVIQQNGEYYTSGTEKNAGQYYEKSSKDKKKKEKTEEDKDKKEDKNEPVIIDDEEEIVDEETGDEGTESEESGENEKDIITDETEEEIIDSGDIIDAGDSDDAGDGSDMEIDQDDGSTDASEAENPDGNADSGGSGEATPDASN